MHDFALLNKIINKKALIQPEQGLYGKYQIQLFEPTTQENTSYTITINNVPKQTIVIKTDKLPAPEHFFNKGYCKRSDFVLLTQKDQKYWMVFIELKRSKKNYKAAEVIQQLKGAEAVMAYCSAIVHIFHEKVNFLQYYQKRFIVITDVNLNKKCTQQSTDDEDMHDTAEKMLKISNASVLQLNQILGKQNKMLSNNAHKQKK